MEVVSENKCFGGTVKFIKHASKIVNTPTNMVKFAINTKLATNPNILYLNIINIITKMNPTISEIKPALIESSPKSGPTVLSSTTVKGVGNATARGMAGKLYGYRAVASADIYAALVQSEVLSA